ncbi:hypothetical protein KP509_39G028200 [Ceratopteris richardii]|uniref:CCHC-type domain-containing protein n=1 Tax=Ceratopteris richardii TaxID=49495 RepID=A0A8T2PZF8_CERRI|nr:hypothetical protein KP509_39G028200 [Ceratopteris richardii]
MAHVFPWKPVKAMKKELLFKCPVWVELVDLASFLWNSIGHVAKVLGKLLYTPSISAPNKNRVCVLWNTSRPFPKTLGINVPNVGRIVIYLKWGNMAGSCFHCGNLGHYSKNCPTLKSEGVNFIPTCPGSKILVPEEQVFGKQIILPATPNVHASKPMTAQHAASKGKEVVTEKHMHPAAPITPLKLNVYKRREGEGVSKDDSRKRGEDAGKRLVDDDGFTPVSYKKALLRGKRLSSGIGSNGLLSCRTPNLMKLATWNIQGLGKYGKWTRLWRWIIRHQLDLVEVQEHKKHDHAGMRIDTRDFHLCYNGIKNKYSGCLFIVRKDIPFQVLFDDSQGRFLILHLTLQGISYICINVYAPNSPMERVRTWETLLRAIHSCAVLQAWTDARILLCGDFNMVDADMDCTTPASLISSHENSIWREVLDFLNCKDLWGCIGVHTIRYTFHSRSHRKAMSRLDRCYYSHTSLLNAVSTMWVDATVLLSDHNPLLVSLSAVEWNSCIPDKFHRIPLRVNIAWLQTSMFKASVEKLIIRALSLKVSPCMKWEFLVAGMQDVIRDCGKYFANTLRAVKVEAEHLIFLMTEKVDSGQLLSERDHAQLCNAYRCLHLIENNAIQSFLCTEHFEKVFAASFSASDAWFMAIQESLAYTPKIIDSRTADNCEKSITEEEVLMALQSLKNGKAPGLDGLTKEFVLAFWSSLKTLILEACNEIWSSQKMPFSFKQGKIKLIPKVEIPRKIVDWRPITMMNIIY